jgi:hypothetical protein
VHGFRSCFKDWCAEQTAYANELSEMELTHTVADKVEAAYRRGDLREKRRRMMQVWATFTANRVPSSTSKITPIRAAFADWSAASLFKLSWARRGRVKWHVGGSSPPTGTRIFR